MLTTSDSLGRHTVFTKDVLTTGRVNSIRAMSLFTGTGELYSGWGTTRLALNFCSVSSGFSLLRSPSVTVYMLGSVSEMQWAAVITQVGAIREPPQMNPSFLVSSFACQGHSPAEASVPPITRPAATVACPHAAVR